MLLWVTYCCGGFCASWEIVDGIASAGVVYLWDFGIEGRPPHVKNLV